MIRKWTVRDRWLFFWNPQKRNLLGSKASLEVGTWKSEIYCWKMSHAWECTFPLCFSQTKRIPETFTFRKWVFQTASSSLDAVGSGTVLWPKSEISSNFNKAKWHFPICYETRKRSEIWIPQSTQNKRRCFLDRPTRIWAMSSPVCKLSTRSFFGNKRSFLISCFLFLSYLFHSSLWHVETLHTGKNAALTCCLKQQWRPKCSLDQMIYFWRQGQWSWIYRIFWL